MEKDRLKWNERYGNDDYFFSLTPTRFLAQTLGRVLPLLSGRRALDIACGEGRHAIYLAGHGFEVDAVDIAERGLERGMARAAELGLQVNFVRADLDDYRLTDRYDLIIDFYFLLRPLIPEMVAALNPGGVIIMETILDTPALVGEHTSTFLLQPGELAQLFSGFGGEILQIEELPQQATPVARVIFRKAGAEPAA